MKKSLIYFLLTGFLFVIGGSILAQETKSPPPPEERAKKLTEWMKANLQLTDEQVPQVQAINLKYANKVEEIRTSSKGRMQKGKALKADNKAKDEELKKIFTPEQYKTYETKKEELKKELKKQMKEKQGGS